MPESMEYTGYLAPHVDLIRTAHARGAGTGEIAGLLFEAGARASTSDPRAHAHELTRAHHVENLRMMTLYALQRLGLRAPRKPRGGLLTARRGRDGSWSIPGGHDVEGKRGGGSWCENRPASLTQIQKEEGRAINEARKWPQDKGGAATSRKPLPGHPWPPIQRRRAGALAPRRATRTEAGSQT
jgi:hypothetical protein